MFYVTFSTFIVTSKIIYIMKSFLVSIALLISSVALVAQEDTQSQFWQNVRFGGGVGLNFGNGFFSGTLAPAAIYDVNPYVSLGLGLSGSYNSFRDAKTTIFGGSLIGLFNPINEIQLSTEFEQLNVSQRFDNGLNPDTTDNFWASALFLGVGYQTGNITFGIRYDILYDEERSIYDDPWLPFIRIWF